MSFESLKKKWENFYHKQEATEKIFMFHVAYNVAKNVALLIVLFGCLMTFLGVGIGTGYFLSLTANETPLTTEEMKFAIKNVDLVSSFLYSDGSKITDVRSDNLRIITTLENISPYVIDGIVATEDSYFYEHNGIVPKALFRAVLQEFISSGRGTTGGSTLTQQLVKQQILSSEVTFKRKANEILYALRLEKHFTKDEILEAYLNISPFGRNHNGLNISGIEEAAQGVFGVSAKDLTLPQAAYLVGMPQNPIVYTPYTNFATMKEDVSAGIKRMKTVLYSMYRENKISKEAYEEAFDYDITKDFLPGEEVTIASQSYLYQAINREILKILIQKNAENDGVDYHSLLKDDELYKRYYDDASLELSTAGYKIHTTIDPVIYQAMQEAVSENGSKLGPTYNDEYVDSDTGETKEHTEMAQNGAILIENKSGRVLGFIGGRDFTANQVDHVFTTHRSPGSTIKPLLVYAPAIENNVIYPASIVPDTKISILQPDGTYWQPTNYGNTISNKLVTARHALMHSYNNPTIKIFQAMLDKGIIAGNYLKDMGIKGIGEDEYRNVALSVGGTRTGPTVAEQTSAFTTLANKGVHNDYYLIEKIEDGHGKVIFEHEPNPVQVFSEETAYMTTDILRGVVDRTAYYNIRGDLGLYADMAGKTGTSEFELDNWFIGYTPEITLGSWIGYDNAYATSKHAITQNDGYGHPTVRSVKNWTYILKKIHQAKPGLLSGKKFEQPKNVYYDSVVAATGTRAGSIDGPDGKPIEIKGDMASDLFKTSFGPLNPTTYFVVGGSSSDLDLYWKDAEEEKKKKEEEERRNSTSTSSSSEEAIIIPLNP